MACKLKDKCKCTHLKIRQRILCPEWYPSRASKYYNCELYELEKVPCPFKGRKCSDCEFYSKLESAGRPNLSGIDWKDNTQVNERRRQRYRERNSDAD